jgi:hypothetical protein
LERDRGKVKKDCLQISGKATEEESMEEEFSRSSTWRHCK